MSEGERVAVVTGGGRGIGRGIVHAIAPLGFSVVVNYRGDEDSARATCLEAERLGSPRAIAIRADVASREEGEAMIREIHDTFGRVDLWVNNAGVAPEIRADLLETSSESWDRVLGINLRGPFFLTQSVARRMIEMVEQGTVANPQIVFVTSVSSTFASMNRGEYCVSKAGLSMVVKLFAVRLAEFGIRVFEIRPGVIATEMTEAVKASYDRKIAEGMSPIARWGTPSDVGRAVAAVASGAFPFSTGEILHVDGGLNLDRL